MNTSFAQRHIARALATGLVIAAPAVAHAEEPAPRISVVGEGEVAVAPDMATMSLTVLREADTAREALDANNQAMGEVLAVMKEEGIADRDLQTSGISLQPRYVYPKSDNSGERSPQIVGYRVSNSLTVRIRDITSVGALLDKSVTLGVNQGGSVSFGNAEPETILTEARKLAVKDALRKAADMAEAAGVKVGKVLDISENSSRPMPRPVAEAMVMRSAQADAVPVASGENTYSVTVSVAFGIDQ